MRKYPNKATNQNTATMTAAGTVQRKLSVGETNDPMEYEADAMADKVMRMPNTPLLQRKASGPSNNCDDERVRLKPLANQITPFIQAKGDGAGAVSDSVSSKIKSSMGGGNTMDTGTRSFMENRFGTDFGGVKIHNNTESEQLSRSLNAKAFTVSNNIYFNSGQYQPETDTGKHLLAHELTHVVQQSSSIQKQALPNQRVYKGLRITDELIEIPEIAGPLPMFSSAKNKDSAAKENSETNHISLVVQRKPTIIQRDNIDDSKPTAPVRKDLVFIMGTKGGFYAAAKIFFSQNHSEAEIVNFKDRSLGGIFTELKKRISETAPAGNIYIVSHANQDGTLAFPLNKSDKDGKISFGELKQAIVNQSAMFETAGGIDEKTAVHIKGCNIGRNKEMLNALDEAFGGKDTVDAPTHKQEYESHSELRNKKSVKVSSEAFNSFIVEYPGKLEKTTDKLIADFKNKYARLGYKDSEWEMMVNGAKKYNELIDKQARAKKSDIDKDSNKEKKATDKSDKDVLKDIETRRKSAKKEVDDWVKEMKTSKVATHSPGVKKNVDVKFTATIYNDVDPSIAPDKALHLVGRFGLQKQLSPGYRFIKCNSIKPAKDTPLSHVFEFLAENKKNQETEIHTYTTQPLPTTNEEANIAAGKIQQETVDNKPEMEMARKGIYNWRIERENKKETITIKAFLEMTQYTIDANLKEESGNKIDPKAVEGDGFYFGKSDF
jgi:hypothetical protein